MAHDLKALSTPSQEWEEANCAHGENVRQITGLESISAIREWNVTGKARQPTTKGPPAGIREMMHKVTMRDGHAIPVKTYQPENPPERSPLVVFIHGGGWSVGGLDNEEVNCRKLTLTFGAVCCNVDYRLAPEHKYPTAAHDAIDATKWAAQNAASLGADPSAGFILSGNSVGGNLVSIVAHIWRDEKLSPPITGCDHRAPVLIWHSHVPEKWKAEYQSWEQNADAPVLPARHMEMFADSYCPDERKRGNGLFSPLLWGSGHRDYPPSTFQLCGMDPLRDDGMIFERHLREDLGLRTSLKIYPGLPHGFGMVAPQMKSLRQWRDDFLAHIAWLLEQAQLIQ